MAAHNSAHPQDGSVAAGGRASSGALSKAFRARVGEALAAVNARDPEQPAVTLDRPVVVQVGRRAASRRPRVDTVDAAADHAVVIGEDPEFAAADVSHFPDYCKRGIFLILRDDEVASVGPYGTAAERSVAQEAWQGVMRQAFVQTRVDPTCGLQYGQSDRFDTTVEVFRGVGEERDVIMRYAFVTWRPGDSAPTCTLDARARYLGSIVPTP